MTAPAPVVRSGTDTSSSFSFSGRFRKHLLIVLIFAFFVYAYLANLARTSSVTPIGQMLTVVHHPKYDHSDADANEDPQEFKFKSFIQLPQLGTNDEAEVQRLYANLGRGRIRTNGEKNVALAKLTEMVQRQLSELEYVSNCEETITISCGFGAGTGLASQILHRQICAMLSYVYKIPLIHDEGSWSYKKPWTEALERVGSGCEPSSSHTLKVIAYERHSTTFLSGNLSLLFQERGCEQNCTLEYPFRTSLPVPKKLHDLVELLHDDPYLWWLGQFTRYMLRIKAGSETERYVNAWRRKLDLRGENGTVHARMPIIGMHIRRTDKKSEALLYPTGRYFDMAAEILRNESAVNAGFGTGPAEVFIASDVAREVLLEARTNFSAHGGYSWSIHGIEDQATMHNQTERSQDRSALDEILRDLYILYEDCDYVICTLSSGICQVLLQLMSTKYADGPSRVKSLDLQVDETIERWWSKIVSPG